ncbi:hypothetical protein DRI50_11925 [candidate division KSB1 bacterium]|nr:MAG: hypothetical protein DRI50_11925 [candidate division KSB1 bacterium]
MRNKLPFIFILLCACTPLWAVNANSESGPMRIGSAWNNYRGSLHLITRGRFYSARDVFTGVNGIESGVTVWDSQTSAALYWGVADHLEMGLMPIISQKRHPGDGHFDIPGDMLLSAKLGSLGAATWSFKMALQMDLRLPLGGTHNIPLNPYSAASIGYGGTALFSANPDSARPTGGLIWDVNVGYFNFNDQGLAVTDNRADSAVIGKSTQQIVLGGSLCLQGKKFGLFMEMFGVYFLQPPPAGAYTRENSIYVSPGFTFRFNPYITVSSSVDYLVLGAADETVYEQDGIVLAEKPWQTIPNLPDWRFSFGLSLKLAQGKPPKIHPKVEKATKAKVMQQNEPTKAKSRKEKERDIKMLEERLKKKNAGKSKDTELQREEKRQRDRERMEALLKKLRQDLKKDSAEKK